ncbi:hypothetical protein G6011_05666 [Alternaria panax]|uniref:Uncharacterized protein n=1 Tax=Alternaria panax TaxID=48097 RepID=A0AAD4FD18_9PLEO|nr:hypothetical protein G6011_05666 [Alternaria panax]
MSSQTPLRNIRIPALQRQCLFLRHQTLIRSAQPTTTHPSSHRTFSSTLPRPKKRSQFGQDKAQTRAAAESQVAPSPKVNFERAQRDTDAMAEDIGLLQNTIVRAPLKDLLQEADGFRGVIGYYWALIKHKGTALYSRYYYRACIQKSGWSKYLPIDPFNNTQYKVLAQRHYKQIQECFAKGNVKPLEHVCLSPLVKKLKQRIAARGRKTDMSWHLHKVKSTRVVSHRAAPLGEEQPDSAYRQVVVRIESVQSLDRSTALPKSAKSASSIRAAARLPWVPDAVRERAEKARQQTQKLEDEGETENKMVNSAEEFLDNGVPKTVVEYLVLQKRVIRGSEEDWKVWGFTQESTPSVIARDERYWSKVLDTQVGPA